MTITDPGHLLPDAAWSAVQAQAEVEAARIAAGHAHASAPTRRTTGALPLAGAVTAPSNGGKRKLGAPRFGVLHSAETPLRAGYAASIAAYFRGGPGTSCHYMVDPAETWGVLNDLLVAWHCGTGNPNSLAVEQAGYARFTLAEWSTPDALAQEERVAAIMRAARARYGIGLYWMTDQQLRDAHAGRIVGGWATHDQCRRVLGGTTHTDPMPNYPAARLMARAVGTTPAPTPQEDELPSAADLIQEEWYGTHFRGDLNYAQVIHAIDDNVTTAVQQLAGLTAAVGALSAAVASGRDDLTAAELQQAVRDGIMDAGAALRATAEQRAATDGRP